MSKPWSHMQQVAHQWFDLGFHAARDCSPELFMNYPNSDLPDPEFDAIVAQFDKLFETYWRKNRTKAPGDL